MHRFLPLAVILAIVWATHCVADDQLPPAFRTTGVRVDVSDFPRITLHFQIVDAQEQPVTTLPDEEFAIYEDGQEVKRFRPTGLRPEALNAVLALDTSGSMERPSGSGPNKMQAAKDAARRFFGKLESKTPCGLVLFHHEPYQIEPPTLDRARVLAFVAAAQSRGGTACFDATYEAIRLLDNPRTTGQRAVVLMTDGRDVNSKHVLASVIREAQRAKTRVYTIGLGQPGRNEAVRTILVLDRSLSMQGKKFENMQRAASRFVALLPPDSADLAILPFDNDVDVVDGFTTNKSALQDEIRRLTPRGETSLFDAIGEAVETLNAAEPQAGSKRRRAVVVLTDGADTNSRRQARDVVERAKADGIKVYVLGLGEPGEIDEPGMKQIAKETGGAYFYVRDPEQLTEIFETLSIQLHDDGIDEHSLQRLAKETGGEYYPVQDADRLSFMFERVATQLESTFTVTFDSQRGRHYGTARGLEIRFGKQAVGRAGYVTHGLITPMSNHGIYLGLLLVLLFFIALPGCARWLGRGRTAREAVRTDVHGLLDLEDTIVALSSAPGGAARAIVRLSGPRALAILAAISPTESGPTEAAPRRWVSQGHVRITGLHAPLPVAILAARGPATFTAQHLVEFHLLGSPPLVDALLDELVRQGARLARPGEFTLRAVLAGKLDLTQAEGILGVITAANVEQLRQALSQMAGGVTHPLQGIRDRLLHLLAEVEAGLDFTEEDLTFVTSAELERGIRAAEDALMGILDSLDERALGDRPYRVVLAGPPNVGKSSLYNALVGQALALVSPMAGTTRDYLAQRVVLDGVNVEFVDTAGEQAGDGDQILARMQQVQKEQVAQADLVLHCRDVRASSAASVPEGLLVLTKCDLDPGTAHAGEGVRTSAHQGLGIEELRQRVAALARAAHRPSALASSVTRCRQHASQALDHLRSARHEVSSGASPEFLAMELRSALEQLGEIVGAVHVDDLLDRIFSQFCIGK